MEIIQNEQNHFDHQNNPVKKNCRKSLVRYLIYSAVISLFAFVSGYFIDPLLLRNIWLIASGTMFVLCGIAIYILYSKIGKYSDLFCIQNCEL